MQPIRKSKKHLYIASALMASMMLTAPAWSDSLLEVYETAKENDPVLGAAASGYQARQEAVPQARSALLPNVAATGQSAWNERRFPGSFVDAGGGTIVSVPDDDFNSHGWQAEVRQPVFNAASWFDYTSAKASVTEAERAFASTEQQLIVRVVEAYLNVLRAQDLLESTAAEEAAVKRQLEQVQQRFDVGLVAITDVLEAQAVFDNTVVRRIQADADQDIFFESLRTLTGRSYSQLNRISESLPIVDPDPQNEDEWVDTALQSNLNIQSAQAQLLAAERTLKARRSGHLPTIDVSVTESHFVTGGLNFLGDTTNQTTYAASINVPIYQGGLTSAQAREARALADQSRQFLLEQQLNVTRNTRSLFRAVATDVVRVRARLKSIRSSESALEAVETGYEVGTRNIVDVLQAQQLLYRSEFDFADSRYNYMSNFLLLKRSVGTLEEADLVDLNAYGDASDPVQRVNSLLNRSVDMGNEQR